VLAAGAVTTGLASCINHATATTHATSSTAAALPGTCLTSQAAPLALAVGVRSNVPTAKLPPETLTLLETTARAGKQISLVRIDGQPKIFTPAPFSTKDKNGPAIDQDVGNYLNSYVTPILRSQVHAQVAQADVLGALALAASATGPDGNIIVVDSGLQTVAPLNYQQSGMMMAPPGDVVAFLRKQDLIPDLKGRHVLLSGFGYTASPQPVLDEAQRTNVISQWEAIIKAGGGCVTADQDANTTAEVPGLPAVSLAKPPPLPVFNNCGTIVLSDAGSVGFVVGKAAFRDPSAAQTTLRQLAGTLKQGSESIKIIGSTSSEGGDAVNNPLSQRRADAVESVLHSMGIPDSRMHSIGRGSHWQGRVNDTGPGGELLPAQAEQDREVVVQLPQCR
jgi:outer membrane protein OmpA-like peptidoglycan-associated protein